MPTPVFWSCRGAALLRPAKLREEAMLLAEALAGAAVGRPPYEGLANAGDGRAASGGRSLFPILETEIASRRGRLRARRTI